MAGLSRIPSTALIFAKLASTSTKPATVPFFCGPCPAERKPPLDYLAEAAARVTAAWITIRLTIEERLELILEESEELLVRFAPQVAVMV